jgi:hypothetical protein
LVLVHNAEPRRRVGKTIGDTPNILWLREVQELHLSYDEQFDRQYEFMHLTQDCEVTFSALGVSGDLKDSEFEVTFRRAGDGDREPGSLFFTKELSWIEIYVEDYAIGFVVMAYDQAKRLGKPLGLLLRVENDDYRWDVDLGYLKYERPGQT